MSANKNGIAMPRARRYEVIMALRAQDKTFREISDLMGVAVSTITNVYYDPTGEQARARKAQYAGSCVDCGSPTSYTTGGPATRCRACARVYQASFEARQQQARTNRGRVKWTDEQILDAIRSIAVDGIATTTAYDRVEGNGRKGQMPTRCTIVWRFGSWRKAVHAAGLRTRNEHQPTVYKNRTSDEGLLCAIEDCAAELGCWPGAAAYDEWARDGRAVSGAIIRQRFGGWMAAIEAVRDRNGGEVPA